MTIPYEIWSKVIKEAKENQLEAISIEGIKFHISEFYDFKEVQTVEFDWIE
jgi:hypothetical protein